MIMAARRNGKPKQPEHNPADDIPTPDLFRRAIKAYHKEEADSKKPLRANPCTSQMDYSNLEVEFLKAIDEYKRRTGRVFMTNTEYFALMTKELNYVKGPTKVEDDD